MMTTSRTTMAAAVNALNSCWGKRAQPKMMVGSEVYGPVRRSRTDALAGEPKPAAAAPTSSSGAVSPNARASVRMMPVRMPGAAYGRTWDQVTSHLVAPTP